MEWARSRRPTARHALALALYLGAMLAAFGPKILPMFTHHFLAGGNGDDAEIFAWSLRWWPHAIAHSTDPLFTTLVWSPTGLNLAAATTMPLPSVLLAPVTLPAGPVAAFNVLALLAPPLSAWTAYLLCHRVTRSFPASLAGGFVFGSSAYEWGQQIGGHPNLSLVFLVPVACYLVVRRLEGSLGVRAFVVLLGAVLAAQFAISTEVLATMTMFGAVVLVLGLGLDPGRRWRPLLRTAGWTLLSYALAAVVVSPYLYSEFTKPQPVKSFRPVKLSTDLANFVVPTKMTWLGHTWFTQVAARFAHASGIPNAYFGVPLLLVLALLAVTGWRNAGVRVLVAVVVVAAVASLGPVLKLAGHHHTGPMPWRAVLHLPLIRRALPQRVVVFAFLAAGIGVAVWASGTSLRWLRWALVGVVIASVLPNTPAHVWRIKADDPAFFTTSEYLRYVSPGETVVIVARDKGDQMLWQAETDMRFRLAGGYMGVAPPHYLDDRFERRLSEGNVASGDERRFRRFVAEHDVGAVIAYRPGPSLRSALRRLTGERPRFAGGVLVYRLGAAASIDASKPVEPSWGGSPATAGRVTPASR